jgi:DNA-binding transcriptional LysR family regulator
MNYHHLKYFIDAARTGSVSRSAEINFVSHSAISQAILGLENYFGVKLVFHAKRKFQLTQQGEFCVQEGLKMLSNIDVLKESLQSSSKEVTGKLVIWAPQSLIVDSLYKTLALYQKKYPKVSISIKPGAAAQVRSAINKGEGHVGLLVDDGFLDNFESQKIKTGSFTLFTSAKKPMTYKDGLIVTSKEKIEVKHLLKNFKTKVKADIPIRMEVMSWGVIKNLVDKGFGVGYVPDYCVKTELISGEYLKLETPRSEFKYDVKAIWAANKNLSPNAKYFVNLLKEQTF